LYINTLLENWLELVVAKTKTFFVRSCSKHWEYSWSLNIAKVADTAHVQLKLDLLLKPFNADISWVNKARLV